METWKEYMKQHIDMAYPKRFQYKDWKRNRTQSNSGQKEKAMK